MANARKLSAPRKKAAAPRKARAASKTTKHAVQSLVAVGKKASLAGRTRGEELLAEIARRMVNIAEAFYEVGEALRELLSKKLYIALGYRSFQEMLAARNVMSFSQANRLIQLVSSLPREKALAVGSAKAFLLVDYAKATPEPDNAAWLLDEGKLPGGKRIADATTREIVAATKQIRAKNGTAKAKSDDRIDAERGARAVQAALRKRGAKSTTASAVKRGGEWWLRFEVKLDHAEALK